ncbi:MAG: riboflavin synthase [Acidobacteria bacterium]|nr:riboflavin synthase [Acidobacteriota bacterium]
MFNGLIETCGTVAALQPIPAGFRILVATALAPELALGESVAVNGVCLTVVQTESPDVRVDGKGVFHAEISPETARVTGLGTLQAGSVVNLERSMRADARVGGHFVQGHVDSTGRIDAVRHEADFHWVTIAFPSALAPLFVRKGSVAVDGISLTVAELADAQFDVQIVPFTWEHTNLRHLDVGATVNLECDIIGKYVVRALEVGEFARPRLDT